MKIVRDRNDTIINAMILTADQVANQRVRCPVCGVKEFIKWPEGWDGHAGYRCAALTATNIELRKKEFKQVASHLFR